MSNERLQGNLFGEDLSVYQSSSPSEGRELGSDNYGISIDDYGCGVKYTGDVLIDDEDVRKDLLRQYAKEGLELYKESHQDVEFEFVEGLSYESSYLIHPDWKHDEEWSHVGFTAKPKNVEVDSPEHTYFFAELERDHGTCNVKYCYTFKPSDDPGFRHGCLICPPEVKINPSKSECVVGFEPCKEVKIYDVI